MIQIINHTEMPLTLIGKIASVCYNSPDDPEKNYKRGVSCLKRNHGKVLEFADVTIKIEGYSARVMREFYTHNIGISKLQKSTRYVSHQKFDFFIPSALKGNQDYLDHMSKTSELYKKLVQKGVKREDIANILPIGSFTTVVAKLNCRAIQNIVKTRSAPGVYSEFTLLLEEITAALREIDCEWAYFIDFILESVNGND